MTGARLSTLATLRGSIERIEAQETAFALHKVALGHAGADATLQGGLARAAVHEVFAEGRHAGAATGFIAGLTARVAPRRPLVWVRQDFTEIEIGSAVDQRAGRTRARSAPAGERARGRCRRRVADGGRCARLRCGGRRGAGSVGRGAATRSRRQPQADAGRPGLRRHLSGAAGGGSTAAFDRGDPMDRARGAFAACRILGCVGGAGVRRATRSQSSWPGWAMDHGMEM